MRPMQHRLPGAVVGLDARYVYHPADNLLVGWPEIANYLRCSWFELDRLIKQKGLPVTRLPDGRYITTMASIDDWLFLATETVAKIKEVHGAPTWHENREDQLTKRYARQRLEGSR